MQRLRKNRSFLLELSKNPNLISKASVAELTCVVEILQNLSNIPFTHKEKKSVCKHLPTIREIAKCTRERKARAHLNQHGSGFLAAVIPAALALISLAQSR